MSICPPKNKILFVHLWVRFMMFFQLFSKSVKPYNWLIIDWTLLETWKKQRKIRVKYKDQNKPLHVNDMERMVFLNTVLKVSSSWNAITRNWKQSFWSITCYSWLLLTYCITYLSPDCDWLLFFMEEAYKLGRAFLIKLETVVYVFIFVWGCEKKKTKKSIIKFFVHETCN